MCFFTFQCKNKTKRNVKTKIEKRYASMQCFSPYFSFVSWQAMVGQIKGHHRPFNHQPWLILEALFNLKLQQWRITFSFSLFGMCMHQLFHKKSFRWKSMWPSWLRHDQDGAECILTGNRLLIEANQAEKIVQIAPRAVMISFG